jgi:hypothetical protein
MVVTVKVPITTAVIEDNPTCVGTADYRENTAVIHLDARRQDHRKILGLPNKPKLHWSNDIREYEAQELSSFPWPIRYHVTTADAWYSDEAGQRVYYTPPILGLDPFAKVSDAVKRTAVILVVIAAIGYRRVEWLLQELFQVSTSKSALARWVKDVAGKLPTKEEIVRLLDQDKPITEGHFDEIFPRGKAGGPVLVLKDEHGRIVVTEQVESRDETHVKAFLERVKAMGLKIRTFYIDTCQSYRKSIPAVFPEALIQIDYFHVIQNVWRHIWKFFVRQRREIAARAEEASTPWYKAKLKALAESLWKNRHVLFKREERMSEEEKAKLAEICEAEAKIGRIRAFLSGVWNIFESSKDAEAAKKALQEIKRQKDSWESPHHKRALNFLDDTIDQSTTYLREPGVKRNSLAECGMRTLRRLEAEHDGFRTDDSREDFLKVYQAVKYLGWGLHGPILTRKPAPS